MDGWGGPKNSQVRVFGSRTRIQHTQHKPPHRCLPANTRPTPQSQRRLAPSARSLQNLPMHSALGRGSVCCLAARRYRWLVSLAPPVRGGGGVVDPATIRCVQGLLSHGMSRRKRAPTQRGPVKMANRPPYVQQTATAPALMELGWERGERESENLVDPATQSVVGFVQGRSHASREQPSG